MTDELERDMYASQESIVLNKGCQDRHAALVHRVRDLEKRFDTLQTPWWKRVWFKIDGWPWYDLNGTQSRRPWHRWTKRGAG